MCCLRLKIVCLDQPWNINSDEVKSVEWPTRSLRERSLLREANSANFKKKLWKDLNVMLRFNHYAKLLGGWQEDDSTY